MSKLSQSIAILGVVAGLGVAALPLSTYADATEWTEGGTTNMGSTEGGQYWVSKDTDIKLVIEDLLSIDTSATEVELKNTAGNTYEGDALTVTVVSRNSKGYNLSIKGTTSDKLVNATGDEIVAAATAYDIDSPATPGVLALNSGASVWGYSLDDGTNFFGVTTSGSVIKNTTVATVADGEETEVTFGAELKDGQAAGTYTGKVTFTATNNPNA